MNSREEGKVPIQFSPHHTGVVGESSASPGTVIHQIFLEIRLLKLNFGTPIAAVGYLLVQENCR